MSGDVQPRRRKDKKRKRDDRKSEGEVIFSRKQSLQDDDESSHGVHSANMGADDQHLHIHEDHGTGGNWYQKCAFVVLMAILLGLVGLIIVENRGLADLDTPLSESRYSEYLHGWVEEHREEHDDHDEVQASLEDHDEHDEPFEEEEDHSEVEEEDDDHEHDDEDDDEDHEDDDEDHEEDDEDATKEQTKEDDADDDDEDVTAEQTEENDDDLDNEDDDEDDEQNTDDVTKEDDDDENDDDDEDVTKTAEDDDDDEDVAKTVEDEDEDDATVEADDDDEDDADDDDDADENNTLEAASTEADNDENDDDDDDDDEDENNDSAAPAKSTSKGHHSKADDDDDAFDEEEDDGTAESLENIVVDNDAEEMLLLQAKERRWAAQNQPPKDDGDDEEPEVAQSFFGNLAVKIGVGVALALVARFVLMRKNPSTNVEPSAEVLMKRRLTIANAEDAYPEDEDAPPLSEDDLDCGEEHEIEEEIEYVEEEEEEIEIELDDHGDELPELPKYIPETFEQLNAMYRSKDSAPAANSQIEEISPEIRYNKTQQQPSTSKQPPAPVFTAPPPPPLVEAKIEPTKYAPTAKSAETAKSADTAKSPETAKVSFTDLASTSGKSNIRALPEIQTREVTHDLDFQPEDEDIDYSTDDDYDEDEEDVEEEEEEIEDIMNDDGSDVDDSELMNRLEAKYGRLPAKEYESDEDPDDPTWTQINPKQTPGGGPQAQEGDFYSIHNKLRQEQKPNIYEDDEYEREMALANDELLRGKHLSALVAFYKITYHFPDRPMGFLGKAKLLDHFGQLRGDINLLTQSVDAYKRYLAFEELIENELQFQQAAEACIRTMHYLGQYEPALTIHRILINRFSDDPEHRNQLANTLLIMNRFLDAKVALVNTLKKWPQDGYAHVLLGYVLKMNDHQYAKAAHHLRLGLDSKAKGTQDARFYIALGDVYQCLNNPDDAHKIYKRGAELKLYPSHYQRSIFNEPNLRAQPIWALNETTYAQHLSVIAENWQTIRYEANSMLEVGGYFRREKENLLAVGNWKELELFSRGKRNHKNCAHAPTTCWLIEQFPAAALCRRGQVKFSVMHAGTQVRPHCGPTNCRLRAHLGLMVPPGTHLRVANHRTTWVEGSFLIFDDSFEHEVWHEGDSIRLILIVDFWHPDLNAEQIERLSAV